MWRGNKRVVERGVALTYQESQKVVGRARGSEVSAVARAILQTVRNENLTPHLPVLVPDDPQAQVLDVEVPGPGHVGDVQGDVVQPRGPEGGLRLLAGPGGALHRRQGRPQAHQPGGRLPPGQPAPLEVLDDRARKVGPHGRPPSVGRMVSDETLLDKPGGPTPRAAPKGP